MVLVDMLVLNRQRMFETVRRRGHAKGLPCLSLGNLCGFSVVFCCGRFDLLFSLPSGLRFHEAGDSQQLPARDVAALNDFRARCHPLDLATVPEHDSKQLPEGFTNLPPLPPPLPPPQDYTGVVNMALDSVGKPGARAPMYSPYGTEQGLGQWMVPSHSQYRAMSYSAFSTDYNAQGASGHAHGTMAEWSQYPLFPYACW